MVQFRNPLSSAIPAPGIGWPLVLVLARCKMASNKLDICGVYTLIEERAMRGVSSSADILAGAAPALPRIAGAIKSMFEIPGDTRASGCQTHKVCAFGHGRES